MATTNYPTYGTCPVDPNRLWPKRLFKSTKLRGGQYGILEVLAINKRKLEIRMGSDFVQLTAEEAETLRNALVQFAEIPDDGSGVGDDCCNGRAGGTCGPRPNVNNPVR